MNLPDHHPFKYCIDRDGIELALKDWFQSPADTDDPEEIRLCPEKNQIFAKWDNYFDYNRHFPGEAPYEVIKLQDAAFIQELNADHSKELTDIFQEYVAALQKSELKRLSKGCYKTLVTTPPAPAKALFMSAAEFLQSSISIQWLINGRIPQNSTGQIFGPSGGGKTFNALDLALAVATGGIALNGCDAHRGLVLYLAGEGHDGLRRRVRAWQLHNGKLVDDLANFYLSRQTLTFNAPDITAIVAEGKALAEQHGSGIALICVDTLARHLAGDENSTRDMGEFISAVDSLRNAFPGSVALIVHHTGHAEDARARARGSSALKGAMDFELLCDKGLLTFTKLKDGETPPAIEFKLLPVNIGVDDNGEPISSCVTIYGERSAKNREASMTPYELNILELVREDPGILIGDLREAFYIKRRTLHPEAKPDTLKKAFDRSMESLIRKKVFSMSGYSVTEGQGTCEGHSRDMSPAEMGEGQGHHPKGVPMSPTETKSHWQDREDIPFL